MEVILFVHNCMQRGNERVYVWPNVLDKFAFKRLYNNKYDTVFNYFQANTLSQYSTLGRKHRYVAA